MVELHRQKQETQKALAGDRWNAHGMIVTSCIAAYIDQTKVSREFKRILKEADLPDIRFHDLRYSSLSFLLDRGAPATRSRKGPGIRRPVSRRDIYGHSMNHSYEEAPEDIEEIVTSLPE